MVIIVYCATIIRFNVLLFNFVHLEKHFVENNIKESTKWDSVLKMTLRLYKLISAPSLPEVYYMFRVG